MKNIDLRCRNKRPVMSVGISLTEALMNAAALAQPTERRALGGISEGHPPLHSVASAQRPSAAKLQVQGVTKIYGGYPDEALRLLALGKNPKEILAETQQVVAVSNVSFSVEQGKIFTIMGLSGSGKSTLVRCLNRLIEPSAGSILVDGEDMLARSPPQLRSIRRSKIAMVFQNFALLPHKSVVENVEFGLMLRGETAAARRKKANQALEQVGLTDWAQRYPDNLSGGMKQRVGLARALASDPDILLMDEPFSALDPLIRSDLQGELLRLQREIRKTIVFITHDFHEAVRLSDQLAVMRDGAFVQVGTAHDIVLRPADSYVATFARELDWSRLLCAGDVVTDRVPVLAGSLSTDEVRRRLVVEKQPHAVIAGPDGAPLGYVRLVDLEAGATARSAASIGQSRLAKVTVTAASTPLSELYALLGGQAPIALVDQAGKVLGAADASDVLRQLNDIAQQGRKASSGHSAPASEAG
jgi:glycine betaine/proline transport system ATP-binding protein